jgi:tRNA threonylcarbamoyladenosine biosynthesis protein TsaB
MRILALETTGRAGSVAVADGPRPIAEQLLDPTQRSAQSLAPGIQRLLTTVGWRASDVELVAVTVGPGSFTGLRVGVATAKALAYALDARCVGLGTLDVIAAQCRGNYPRLSAAIDAQRGQVFAAEFERRESSWQMIAGPKVLSNQDWLESLNSGVAASGPALARLARDLPAGVNVVERDDWHPRAATVAELAWSRHLAGAYDDLRKLAPLYLRKSAAEEKLSLKL